jgi:hypothetical protein
MITDIFARRYEGVLNFDQASAQGVISPTLVQAVHIFFQDVRPTLGLLNNFFSEINRQLARELGLLTLWDEPRPSLG